MDIPAKPPLLAIVGPTGAGKSALALFLAEKLGAEIVNCDSLQLYRGLDIGTAKTPLSERRGIPHHLLDVLDLRQGFSAGEFGRLARSVVTGITSRSRLPLVVGGTGFYLTALLEGLPALPPRDDVLRTNLVRRERLRPGLLSKLLRRLDPQTADRIHGNDQQKALRALEVRILTGRSRTHPVNTGRLQTHRVLKLGLAPDRVELQRRLEHRTEILFKDGLVDEVRGLLTAGATGAEKPFEALGYKQALRHLRGLISFQDAVTSTVIETRQYAKRQMTWFRRDPEILWLNGFGDSPAIMAQALESVGEWLRTGHVTAAEMTTAKLTKR